MLKRHVLPVCSVFALLLTSCAREQENFHYYYFTEDETQVLNQYLNLPELPDDYTQNIPVHLRMSGVLPRASQNEIAMLGRVLFYDKKLSKDGKISCASVTNRTQVLATKQRSVREFLTAVAIAIPFP